MSTTRQFCTFYLGDSMFGIDVQTIQEVICYQTMTPVPLAPATVSGLINLRGQIVTAIDLRARLELPPRTGDRLPTNVIVRTPDGAVSLLVDEIGDVVDVDAASFETCPETLEGRARELVTGVHKLDGRLLLVVDVESATAAIPTLQESQT